MTHNDVRKLIYGLEHKTWPIERWHHDAHLAMTVWYLTYLPRRQALRVIRQRVAGYSAAHDLARGAERRYHETVTTFLAQGIGAFVDALPEKLTFEQRLRRALASFRDFRPLILRFYTEHTLASATARARFVEPDLQPLHEWSRYCAALASPEAKPETEPTWAAAS